MALFITHNNQTFTVGDTIKVNYKIKEGSKERVQAFDGIMIAVKAKNGQKNFTVKKNASDKITVERIFPENSPWIESIKKLRGPKTKIRRSKLYFLRDPKARKI